jgi:hypothetical protein
MYLVVPTVRRSRRPVVRSGILRLLGTWPCTCAALGGASEYLLITQSDIVARGGLRAVLNAEFDTSAAETTTGPPRLMKKAKEENIPSP